MFCLRDAGAGDTHLLGYLGSRHAEGAANCAQPALRRRFQAGDTGRSVVYDVAVLLLDDCFDAHVSTHMFTGDHILYTYMYPTCIFLSTYIYHTDGIWLLNAPSARTCASSRAVSRGFNLRKMSLKIAVSVVRSRPWAP